ncbi:hypothetical protein [Microcystis phage Mwe-JY05]
MSTPPVRPDWGTAPLSELPMPQGLVLAVFSPFPSGAAGLVVFGPLRPDATDADADTLLARARVHAEQTGGTVVRLTAIADYSGGLMP